MVEESVMMTQGLPRDGKRARLCHSDGPLHTGTSADWQPGWAQTPLMKTLQPCGPAESLHTGARMIPNMALKRKIPPDLCLGVAFGGKKIPQTKLSVQLKAKQKC